MLDTPRLHAEFSVGYHGTLPVTFRLCSNSEGTSSCLKWFPIWMMIRANTTASECKRGRSRLTLKFRLRVWISEGRFGTILEHLGAPRPLKVGELRPPTFPGTSEMGSRAMLSIFDLKKLGVCLVFQGLNFLFRSFLIVW